MNSRRNGRTITAKITYSVTAILAISLVSGFFGLRAIDGLGRTVRETAARNAKSLALVRVPRCLAWAFRETSRGRGQGQEDVSRLRRSGSADC